MKKIRSIDWVICAAGNGRRFKEQNIHISKPNIKLFGRTFLERAVSCLDIMPGDQIIIITQSSDNIEYNINEIKSLYPWAKTIHIKLKKKTSGQLDTFYKSRKYLRKDASVAIWNCDTYFKSKALTVHLRNKKFDGLVPCGKMPGKHWSFFKTNEDQIIVDAMEKVKISDNASVGFYFFKSSSRLLKNTEKLLKTPPCPKLKEHYVSSLYPILIEKGFKFLHCPVDLFLPFGTPQEVVKYWNTSMVKFKKENKNE